MAKHPKQFGKRPVMFYQEGIMTFGASGGPRVRIFYPDGNVEWIALATDNPYYHFKSPPCWLDTEFVVGPKSIEDSVRLAEEYDQDRGFPKMEFLGEL